VLADFAKSIGVGNNKRVVIQLDQAGWHGPQNLTLPDGISALLPASRQHILRDHRPPRQGHRRTLRRPHGAA
jgi:hypothetical protein